MACFLDIRRESNCKEHLTDRYRAMRSVTKRLRRRFRDPLATPLIHGYRTTPDFDKLIRDAAPSSTNQQLPQQHVPPDGQLEQQ